MEKKILVPVTLQKDARLGDLDVDVELEVSCSLSHETAPPPIATPSQPVAAAWGLSGRPIAVSAATAEPHGAVTPGPISGVQDRDLGDGQGRRDTEEQTMAFDTARTSRAVTDALSGTGRAAAGKSLPVTKPAPKVTGSKADAAKGRPAADSKAKPSSKTKIDNVLDELLKKKTKK